MSLPTVLYPSVGGGVWFEQESPVPIPIEPPLPRARCLPAILLGCRAQEAKIKRLVDYCRRLDGTDLRVIQIPDELDRARAGYNASMLWALEHLRDPWICLEPDSIPLKAYWASAITREYERGKKPLLLPSMAGACPADVASGIGVWRNVPGLFPKPLPLVYDRFVYNHRRDLVHFSGIIQHSYGLYEASGREHVIRRWRFPFDKALLRPEAVMFHSDPTQSLIDWKSDQSYFHHGDLGDIIAALPVIASHGGGRLYLGPARGPAREPMTKERFDSIAPFLRLQPYLHSVEFMERFDKDAIDHDLSLFRGARHTSSTNLIAWHARYLGAWEEAGVEPWLAAELKATNGAVLASRTPRYNNPLFPWAKIAQRYGDRLLFVGSKSEHQIFERLVERRVEHAITPTVLDLANLIAGADMQFSNQSLPWWIAAGLGKRVVQETWWIEPNSVIDRPGLIYTRTPDEIAALELMLEL